MKKAPHLLISKGDVSEYALLPGDPKRAHLMAKFLTKPMLISENREFVVYKGKYRHIEVTIASTGIGGPSAAITVEELAQCGTKVFIRVGTCGALIPGIRIGEIIVPYGAVRFDGTSARYVDLSYPAVAHPQVFQALLKAARKLNVPIKSGIILSDDMFYSDVSSLLEWGKRRVLAVEMEASTIFVVSSLKGLKAGAILAVDGNLAEGTGKGEAGAVEGKELRREAQKAVELEIRIALEALCELSKVTQ